MLSTANAVDEAASGEYSDYAGSEQAAMALQSLAYNYLMFDLIPESTYDALEQNELGRLLAAVDNPDTFKPRLAQKRFRELAAKLKGK